MRRRDFISVIAGAAAWPLVARAQQSAMPVIGSYLATAAAMSRICLPRSGGVWPKRDMWRAKTSQSNTALPTSNQSFCLRLPRSCSAQSERHFRSSSRGGCRGQERNEQHSCCCVDLESDPVAKGYVKSLARPGGNMTGVFLDLPELSGKQMGLLKEIVPRLSRIAIFGVPGLNAAQFAAAEAAARAVGVEAEILEVQVADDFEGALEAARTQAC